MGPTPFKVLADPLKWPSNQGFKPLKRWGLTPEVHFTPEVEFRGASGNP